MKKIITLTTILAAAAMANADNVAVTVAKPAQPAQQQAAKPEAQKATVAVVVAQSAQEAKAAAPAAQCPAKKAECKKQFVSALGKNWASFGGFGGDINGMAAFGAVAQVNVNVFECKDCDFGLDVSVPLQYIYASVNADTDAHQFMFPVNLRPYYRVVKTEDVVITPYLDCGVGGLYSYMDNVSDKEDLLFTWQLGAGVEIAFCKDFSFTPKYSYNRVESAPYSYYQVLGAEFAWKFTCNMVASVEYQHWFMQDAHSDADLGFVKIRYEF